MASGECEAIPAEKDEADRAAPVAARNGTLRHAGSFVLAARAGLQVVGAGHVQARCSTTGELSCTERSEDDFEERSYVKLGVDGLIHVAPGLRLGLSYELVPYSALKMDGDETTGHLGHEHALSAAIEGLLPLSPNLAIALRGQAGLRMLVIGGDLADDGDDLLAICRDAPGARCEVDQGVLFGSSFGAMLGFVGGTRVRWRVDLAVERVTLALPESYARWTDTTSITRGATLYATRSWVLGGIEL